MGKGTGILLDPQTGDLQISVRRNPANGMIAGGLVVGHTTGQNQALLLAIYPGEIKTDPLIGVGISDITLDENNMLYWRLKVRQAFEQDGMKIKQFTFESPDEMYIDAEYK